MSKWLSAFTKLHWLFYKMKKEEILFYEVCYSSHLGPHLGTWVRFEFGCFLANVRVNSRQYIGNL